jgi:hypothetical protein
MLAQTTNSTAARTVMPPPYPKPGLIRCAEMITSTHSAIGPSTGNSPIRMSHGLNPPHPSTVATLRTGTHPL